MQRDTIRRLADLDDEEAFAIVAQGIASIVGWCERLEEGRVALYRAGSYAPARVLRTIAEEEAAKVLILLDFVRCPRDRSQRRMKCLTWFQQHFAKQTYTEFHGRTSNSFGDLKRQIEHERPIYYLDGPIGTEWIFYNDFLARREQKLYVDVWYDDCNGKYGWGSPAHPYWWPESIEADGSPGWMLAEMAESKTSKILQLVAHLYRSGSTSAEGLAIIAQIWREIVPTETMSVVDLEALNRRTVEEVELTLGGVVEDRDHEDEFVRMWNFPMWSLDLDPKKITRETLEDERRRSEENLLRRIVGDPES